MLSVGRNTSARKRISISKAVSRMRRFLLNSSKTKQACFMVSFAPARQTSSVMYLKADRHMICMHTL